MSCFLFHKWFKWREIGRGDIHRGFRWEDRDNWRKVGTVVRLERDCERCGFKQFYTLENVSSD